MIITEEFVQAVRPKRLSQDDKYSVKMYKYLKEKIGKDLSVFHGTKNASYLRYFISYSTTQDRNLSESISGRRNLPVNFLGEVFKRGNKTDDYSAAPNESIIKNIVEDKD